MANNFVYIQDKNQNEILINTDTILTMTKGKDGGFSVLFKGNYGLISEEGDEEYGILFDYLKNRGARELKC